MSSNEEITQRIIEALKAKMGIPKCPLCGNNSWKVEGGYIVLPLSPNPTQVIIGGTVYPIIPIFCGHCGNTQLINLLTLGFNSEDFKSMEFTENVRQ